MAQPLFVEPIREAGSAGRRAGRASSASRDIEAQRNRAEREAVQQLLRRLQILQSGLRQRLLADGITEFRRQNLRVLLADVDRMIVEATADLATIAKDTYDSMDSLGSQGVDDPLRAAQLTITKGLPGVGGLAVTAAFDNTVDLLTAPMQQFATDVKVSVRRAALAGDNSFEELQRLRDKIAGKGFDNAQFKAERIIRTELGRVFNMATFERLQQLAADFPFLRKGWRTSKDSRVRIGHQQAGKTYARGQGIKIAEPFQVNVYDERGKAPKLIGVATLLFPVDPNAQPAGRIAAGATIMCRCNAFVDINLEDFAAFTAAKVQAIVPDGPVPSPIPVVPVPKGPKMGTTRRRTPKPKVAVPTAKGVMTGAAGVPVVSAAKPNGPKVSEGLNVKARSIRARVEAALAEIDKVHGDGLLPKTPLELQPLYLARKGYLGEFAGGINGSRIRLSKAMMGRQQYMGTFHEVGHFLDFAGMNSKQGGVSGFATSVGVVNAKVQQALDELFDVLAASESAQRLKLWRDGYGKNRGNGIVPSNVGARTLDYLLDRQEVFARAYAQYVSVKSGSAAAMAELRNMQAASKLGLRDVPAAARYNGTPLGTAPVNPDGWDYPWQWQDADFKPIEAAFDKLMEVLEWRKGS